jgi:hypothetical protein
MAWTQLRHVYRMARLAQHDNVDVYLSAHASSPVYQLMLGTPLQADACRLQQVTCTYAMMTPKQEIHAASLLRVIIGQHSQLAVAVTAEARAAQQRPLAAEAAARRSKWCASRGCCQYPLWAAGHGTVAITAADAAVQPLYVVLIQKPASSCDHQQYSVGRCAAHILVTRGGKAATSAIATSCRRQRV